MFDEENEPLFYQMEENMATYVQKDESVISCHTKLQGLWEDLDNMGGNTPCVFCTCTKNETRRRLIKFLMALNDNFLINIRGKIMNTKPLPSIAQPFAMIVNDERQRSISITESTACVVYRGNPKPSYKGESKGQLG